jgi:hypothetical protein
MLDDEFLLSTDGILIRDSAFSRELTRRRRSFFRAADRSDGGRFGDVMKTGNTRPHAKVKQARVQLVVM